MTNTREVMQQALWALVENARLLGATQAKQLFGCYLPEDGRLERALHENIAKHSATLRAALQEPQPEPVAWMDWWRNHGQYNFRATSQMTFERCKELMKLAFEVGREATPTLCAALAEPQPEPVAWADKISFEDAMKTGKGHDVWPKAGDYESRTGRALIGLYTTPPKRQPLTKAEIDDCWLQSGGMALEFARALEKAHNIGGDK